MFGDLCGDDFLELMPLEVQNMVKRSGFDTFKCSSERGEPVQIHLP